VPARVSESLWTGGGAVRECMRRGGWRPMAMANRAGELVPHRACLAYRLQRHRGSDEVTRCIGSDVPKQWPACAKHTRLARKCRSTPAAASGRV